MPGSAQPCGSGLRHTDVSLLASVLLRVGTLLRTLDKLEAVAAELGRRYEPVP
jgi:hypothetical protein